MRIEEYLKCSPVFSILFSARKLSTTMDKALAQHGVNYLEAMILVSLYFENDNSSRPAELAFTFRTSKSNVSHCLLHLEKTKKIRRSSVSADARGYLIQLTSRGEQTALALVGYFDKTQRSLEAVKGEAGILALVREVMDVANHV